MPAENEVTKLKNELFQVQTEIEQLKKENSRLRSQLGLPDSALKDEVQISTEDNDQKSNSDSGGNEQWNVSGTGVTNQAAPNPHRQNRSPNL